MPSSDQPPVAGVPRRRQVLRASAVTVTALVAASVAVPADAAAAPPVSDVTMIQANILTGLPVAKFQADVRKVLAPRPDFVTYNEVPWRNDAVMAPTGYDLYRSNRNRYTKATAVAWRTDRWTKVGQGTFRISNYRKIPRGRKIKLGLRFANWVTLRSAEGRQLSVVAAHLPPLDRNMPDLARSSTRRVGRLVGELASRGPVLVGGDFNVHYGSGRYPRAVLRRAGMVPTYDTLGTSFSTGDHHGATIDYVFNRGGDLMEADQHRKLELYSDHDAVVAGLSWTADAPGESTRLVSNPSGDRAARRLAASALVDTLRDAGPGERVDLVTPRLALVGATRHLKRAVARGVHVRVTTRSAVMGRQERRLTRFVEHAGDPASRVRVCDAACRRAWRRARGPRTLLLVSDAAGVPRLRTDVSRPVSSAMVRWRTRLTRYTGSFALADGEHLVSTVS